MTDKQSGVEVVRTDEPAAAVGFQRNAVAFRMEVPTLKVPTLEEWEEQVRAGRQRAHTALERATDALGRLRALPGALGAVARLHVPAGSEWDRWACEGCEGCCDRPAWPCATVETIADELGIVLPASYDLPARDPEPLDAPIPPLPDDFLGLAPGTDYFIRLPRLEGFAAAFERPLETLSTILDPDPD